MRHLQSTTYQNDIEINERVFELTVEVEFYYEEYNDCKLISMKEIDENSNEHDVSKFIKEEVLDKFLEKHLSEIYKQLEGEIDDQRSEAQIEAYEARRGY